jgi:ubiquinone/menaquinone biosynthesis C-methylase UbiE
MNKQTVKNANKNFYDIVGSSYEEIDGRRDSQLLNYISYWLKYIQSHTGSGSLLDLGCGSGIVSIAAKNIFNQKIALDISHNIIKAIDNKKILKLTADSDFIPIVDDHFNAVVTFAVLHHCFDYDRMFKEVYRVLKKGGTFYSDHDMDSYFYKRYKMFLKLYRKINNSQKRYLQRYRVLSEHIYQYAEIHQNGIDSIKIESILKKIGFSKVLFQYHWFGLSNVTDKIFGKNSFKRGNAPLARIIAVK